MSRTVAISLCLVALLLSGCATVFSGTTETIQVRTRPPGAHIKIESGDTVIHEGTAPWQGTLRKRLPVKVTASAPGFPPTTMELARKRTGWYIANISTLMFCWIGFIVDRRNGSAWVFRQKEYMVTLNPEDEAPPEKKPPPPKPPPPEKKPDKPKVLTEDDYD